VGVKRAFIVIGPESTGTRLWTRVLIGCGCYGDGGHSQRLDAMIPKGEPLIVWRRSAPHAHKWPDLAAMAQRLRGAGYPSVQVLVTTRDWWATTRAQVRDGHVRSEDEAASHLRIAYAKIFDALYKTGLPFTVLSYEGLAQRGPAMIARLAEGWGLEAPAGWRETFFDGNAKYYERDKC